MSGALEARRIKTENAERTNTALFEQVGMSSLNKANLSIFVPIVHVWCAQLICLLQRDTIKLLFLVPPLFASLSLVWKILLPAKLIHNQNRSRPQKVKQTRLQSKQNPRTKKQYWRLLFCSSTAALIVQRRGPVKSFALLCQLHTMESRSHQDTAKVPVTFQIAFTKHYSSTLPLRQPRMDFM